MHLTDQDIQNMDELKDKEYSDYIFKTENSDNENALERKAEKYKRYQNNYRFL